MVEDDVSYISLHQVYEDFCNRSGVHKDQAIDFYVKSVEEAMSKRGVCFPEYNWSDHEGKGYQGMAQQCQDGNRSVYSSEYCTRYIPS